MFDIPFSSHYLRSQRPLFSNQGLAAPIKIIAKIIFNKKDSSTSMKKILFRKEKRCGNFHNLVRYD